VYADVLILDMAIYKAGCASIRLKSGINSSAYIYSQDSRGHRSLRIKLKIRKILK
jgi:hypothetical protein